MTSLKNIFEKIKVWACQAPTGWDAFVLCVGAMIIMFHPFYLFGTINFYEAGLYLPGIEAVLNGLVPYRDFFHLRGPLELYVPAFFMALFGKYFAVLPTYFYVGTMITFIFAILIAKNVLRSRLFLYLVVCILIARTFPRVSFTIGGGIRFAWGLAAMLCFIHYIKKRRPRDLLLTGLFSAIGLATSMEIGGYCFLAVVGTLAVLAFDKDANINFAKSFALYIAGTLFVILPLGIYFLAQGAVGPLLDAHFAVLTNMTNTFPQYDPVPENALEVLWAMINPNHTNFKHMTPLYCFLFMFIYLWHLRKNREAYAALLPVAFYAVFIFLGSMRILWGPTFESAIMSEKILLFILLERIYFHLKNHLPKQKQFIAVMIIFGILGSTLGFSISRFARRFNFMQITFFSNSQKKLDSIFPFSKHDLVTLDLPRMKGMVAPQSQAEDVASLHQFLHTHSKPTDRILFLPDSGVYHFIMDRPFVGRFPVMTLSWIGKGWFEEFKQNLKNEAPKYIVIPKELPEYFVKTHLIVPENQRRYDEVISIVNQNYKIVSEVGKFNVFAPTIAKNYNKK